MTVTFSFYSGATVFAFGIGADISTNTLLLIGGSLNNVQYVAAETDLDGFVMQFLQSFPCSGPSPGAPGQFLIDLIWLLLF